MSSRMSLAKRVTLPTEFRLANGGYFNIKKPIWHHVRLKDIAHSLSMICRYNGHTPRFYSVAEHLIHCWHRSVQLGHSWLAQRAVFMHDATEAYCQDIIRPLKRQLKAYKAIEARIEGCISRQFQIAFDKFEEQVKEVDNQVFVAEKNFMWPDKDRWHDAKDIEPVFIKLNHYSPSRAKSKFLAVARDLGIKELAS